MTAYVFTGPTLSAEDARAVCDAIYLPPVAQGDVYRIALRQPRAIGIIDGYFHQVPSVWHKEILWAMGRGIHVFGSASMGALRAAELAQFGVEGIGYVFEAYRDGVLEDDDEVAVVHGSPEFGYRAASEAMINIRRTLESAESVGVIGKNTREKLENIGKGLFYQERTYEKLLACAAEQALSANELDALGDWLPQGRVDQKRDDALAMLVAMRALLATGPEPKRVSYRFERTEMWDEATTFSVAVNIDSSDDTESLLRKSLLDELRLEGQTYHDARRAAMLRLLALRECGRQRLAVTRNTLKRTKDKFLGEVELFNRKDVDRWLAENHLSLDAFDRLMEDEARIRALESMAEPVLDRHIVDHLRATGDYARLVARARHKQEVLASRGMLQPAWDDVDITALDLVVWNFEHRLGRPIPDDIDDYAGRLGFPNTTAFHRALRHEYLYLSSKEQRSERE